MRLENEDPMNPNNWWHKNDSCVFYRNDEQNVFGTGHASFTTSPGNCVNNVYEFEYVALIK